MIKKQYSFPLAWQRELGLPPGPVVGACITTGNGTRQVGCAHLAHYDCPYCIVTTDLDLNGIGVETSRFAKAADFLQAMSTWKPGKRWRLPIQKVRHHNAQREWDGLPATVPYMRRGKEIDIPVSAWAVGLIEVGPTPGGPLRWPGLIGFANLPQAWNIGAILGEPFFLPNDLIEANDTRVLVTRHFL